LKIQPSCTLGLALSASTKRARAWQAGLVRTAASLYGWLDSPVNMPSSRAQASGIPRNVCTTPTACGAAGSRWISGVGSTADAGNAIASNRKTKGRIGELRVSQKPVRRLARAA
jgi:hypothetical protein